MVRSVSFKSIFQMVEYDHTTLQQRVFAALIEAGRRAGEPSGLGKKPASPSGGRSGLASLCLVCFERVKAVAKWTIFIGLILTVLFLIVLAVRN